MRTSYSTFARLGDRDGRNSDSECESLILEEGEYQRIQNSREAIPESTTYNRVITTILRGGMVIMFLATLCIVAVSWSQGYPESNLVHQLSTLGVAFGVMGVNGINSAISTTTITTTTDTVTEEGNESGSGGDFLSGFIDTISTADETSSSNTTSSVSLQWSMTRSGYAPLVIDEEILKYRMFDGIDTIIEPHAINSLFVTGIDNTVFYRYQLCPQTAGSDCYYGVLSLNTAINEEVSIDCEPFDVYTVIIKEYEARSGDETANFQGVTQCMYVRREIRSLSESDLSASLDAMYVMWATGEDAGQEMYGDDYHSAEYLLKIHHFNAAWQDADHIHEGNGFLAQHIKMTNIFEKSMQAVNPAVSLPYWDFTIDNAAGKSAFNSVVMTETTFGSMFIPTNTSWGFSYEYDKITDGAIPDGRWAYLESPMNDVYEELLAGYGYMRAPWNMNPSPYISRFLYEYKIGISLPSCTEHYSILTEDSLSSFMYNMQNDPHATTHSLSGGIYGCESMAPLLSAGYLVSETQQKELCSKWVFFLKEFYRYGYLAPKSDCVVEDDVQSSQCGFDCATDTKTLNSFMTNLQTKLSSYVPADMADDGWYAWKDFVCTGDGGKIFSGDHLESASPHDPSFWVIHPTLERLFQAKMMAGGFSDSAWATDPLNQFVCEKAECYNSESEMFEYSDECCYGHYENDRFLDFLSGNRSSRFGDTNGEIIIASDPSSSTYSMPYIYDTFTWNHCTEDFSALFESINTEMSQYQVTSAQKPGDVVVPTTTPTHKPTHPTPVPTRRPTRRPTQTSSKPSKANNPSKSSKNKKGKKDA